MSFLKGFQFKSYNTAEKRGSEEKDLCIWSLQVMILLINNCHIHQLSPKAITLQILQSFYLNIQFEMCLFSVNTFHEVKATGIKFSSKHIRSKD